MSTGVKVVLIGCGLVFVIALIAFGVGGYFVKKYAGEGWDAAKNIAGSADSEYGQKIARLSEKYPFTSPSDALITEKQLQRFLAVRKSLFSVYKNHEAEIEKLKTSQGPDFQSAMKSLSMVNDLRKAQAEALEDQHMSLEEYKFIVTSVYATWMSKITEENMKPMADSARAGLVNTLEQLEKQLSDPNVPDSVKDQLKQTKKSLQSQLQALPDQKELDQFEGVPQANVDLFTRYQKEIQQYQMSGLEYVGF